MGVFFLPGEGVCLPRPVDGVRKDVELVRFHFPVKVGDWLLMGRKKMISKGFSFTDQHYTVPPENAELCSKFIHFVLWNLLLVRLLLKRKKLVMRETWRHHSATPSENAELFFNEYYFGASELLPFMICIFVLGQ